MDRNIEEIRHAIQPLLVELEKDLKYTAPNVGDDLRGITESMYAHAVRTGIPFPEGSASRQAFATALSYAYFCYPYHPLEARVYVGIYTWLATIVDDSADKDPEQWAQFILRYHTGRRHHNAVAREFARWLRLAYRYYDPIVANFIITSTLNFVNSTVLEGAEVPKLKPTAGGQSWPYYLRDKTGIADAYAWFIFPKAAIPDVSLFMEAVPEMNKYIVFINDIYSFYKEQIAGEKANYIHAKAAYEEGDVMKVYKDLIAETVDAQKRILQVLEGRDAYARAWKANANGYIAFHKNSKRYRLDDMALAESRLSKELADYLAAQESV